MKTIRLIGDVHGNSRGNQDCYKVFAQEAEYSVQLGDMGFDYWALKDQPLDPTKHKIIAGNHDNYDRCGTSKFLKQTDHFLGDYGVHAVPGWGEFFFVRGGKSIDWQDRVEGKDWWPAEELTYAEGMKALELYQKSLPKVVLSHECPASIIDHVSGEKTWNGQKIKPSMTAQLLQSMWEFHKPQFWIFGHHHRNWVGTISGTRFRCLSELSYIDLDNYSWAKS